MTPLHISNLGIHPTGREKPNDPRREYKFTNKGRYILASFFEIKPTALQNLDTPTIWLMPVTVEDLIIFHAFTMEKARFVVIKTIDEDGAYRELSKTDDLGQAKIALEQRHRVLPNPEALPCNTTH